ncbi:nucleoporin autopeptidase-domain-containing protein, partial [Blyttiomyces helicus]
MGPDTPTPATRSSATITSTPGGPSSASKSPAKTAPTSAYQMVPAFEELMLLSDDELRNVEGYKVILPGVGQVEFLAPVDLLDASPTSNRNGIRDIPGTVIIFKPKICSVYPDEENKAPPGSGVNVRARITLESCWPVEKATRTPITDKNDPRVFKHIDKLTRMEGTEYVGFNGNTGAWCFCVSH